MDTGSIGWGLQTVIGAAILALVLLWAVLRNRKPSKSEMDRTEAGTREVYRQEEADREHVEERKGH
jgi:LPXTG-motif cell wall-anchored protein